LSFTRSRARSRIAAAIFPSKSWGQAVKLGSLTRQTGIWSKSLI